VLAALKATAKRLKTVAKLPAGKHGGSWRASIDGLVVHGGIRTVGADVYETYWVEASGVDHARLMVFAEQIAALAGNQAVIGDTDDEFWPAKQPKPKRKRT
jgi:hypothetical protein